MIDSPLRQSAARGGAAACSGGWGGQLTLLCLQPLEQTARQLQVSRGGEGSRGSPMGKGKMGRDSYFSVLPAPAALKRDFSNLELALTPITFVQLTM